MAKSLKFGNVVLCEHVARGDRGKHTLVNVFSGDIIVAELPANLQFGLYFEYFPIDESPQEMRLRIKLDRKVFMEALIAFPNSKIGVPSAVAIQSFAVGIDNDLTLSVEGHIEGYSKKTILSKKIYKGTIRPA